MRVLMVLCLAAVLAVYAEEMKRYDGYQLYSVYPKDDIQSSFVRELQGDVEFDFWYEGPDRVDIFLPPHKIESFVYDMTSRDIQFVVANSNVQQGIDEELRRFAARETGKPINYDDFNNLADINAELDDLASRCPSGSTCQVFSIGNSVQNRPIRGLRIYRSGTGRKGVWLDATIHAREWLSTATLLKIARHFIYDFSDPFVARLLQTYDWYLFPVINPDGYSYTWTNERLWRKSRNTNPGSTCIGTDLNRNFEQKWANAGSSTNPCSETFHGARAGSEPETQALQNALRTRGSTFLFTVHFHTYGYLWLIPWGSVVSGSTCEYATDNADMLAVANVAANAVQSTYNQNTWARGNSCATIYPAAGITMDYTKAIAGVKYTYTPELRGNNFVIANTHIEPSYREVWNGLMATVTRLENLEKNE